MDRTERFYRIDRLLRSRKLLTLEQFLRELEVSKATFKRDLEYLRDRFNAPIIWDASEGAYRYEGDAETYLPGFWLSASELHALLSIEHLLESLEPGLLSETLQPFKARTQQALGGTPKKLREVRQRVKMLQMARRSVAVPHFAAIASALLERRQLQLTYRGRARDDVTERVVSPQRLVYYRDNWYLDGWCHMRKGLRSFSVDAVEAIKPMDQPAKEISDAELDRYLASGYGIFGGEATTWAKLRFSAERARWVSRESWHPKQKGSFDEQGRYILELPYSDHRELLLDILRHGKDVTVLAPASLRKAAIDQLAEAIALYN